MKTHVEWLSARQAATHLGFVDDAGEPQMNRFYVWKHRHRPKTHRLGGSLRFRVVDLDRCIEAEPEPLPASKRLKLVGAR